MRVSVFLSFFICLSRRGAWHWLPRLECKYHHPPLVLPHEKVHRIKSDAPTMKAQKQDGPWMARCPEKKMWKIGHPWAFAPVRPPCPPRYYCWGSVYSCTGTRNIGTAFFGLKCRTMLLGCLDRLRGNCFRFLSHVDTLASP